VALRHGLPAPEDPVDFAALVVGPGEAARRNEVKW
jgi:hypothetical protein